MKKGISLIVLVITIIVIIILSGSVILSLSNNNPIIKATEAAFKQSAQEYNSALALYLASQYANAIPAGSYNPAVQANFNASNIDTVIPNIKTEDKAKYEIQEGKLVIGGTATQIEKNYVAQLGIKIDARLLSISGVPGITFNSNLYNYTTEVAVASIKITPTAFDPAAIININGQIYVSGVKTIALAIGSNTITISVTCSDGNSEVYSFFVNRVS